MSIFTVDRDAVGAPCAGEAADGGPMPVARYMSRGSENHGGASLDHGTQENDGTPENRGTHGAHRTCFRFAGSMAPTPISPDDATGKLRLSMPPGDATRESGLPMPPDDATGKLRLSMPPGDATRKSGLPMPPGVGRLRERLEDYRRRRAKQAGWTRRFVTTGLAALDAALPHGGLPCGAVTEILADDVGVGSMTLALRIAARCVGMIDDDRGPCIGSGGFDDPTGKPNLAMPPGAGMIGDDRGLCTGSGGLGDPTGKSRCTSGPMPPGRMLHEPSIHASAAREACHPTTGKLRLPMPPDATSPRGATGPGVPGSARADQEDRRYLVVVDTGNDFYPPAARQHGIELDRLIVVRVRRPEEAFWVVDQALRCRAVAVVIAALPQLDDRQSRRLQLAAESTGGIGLILRSARRRTKSFAAVRMRVEGVACTGSGAVPRKDRSEFTPLLAKEGLGEVPDSSCNPPQSPLHKGGLRGVPSPLGKGGRKRCNLSGNGRVPCLPRSGGVGIRMLREPSIHASAVREACHPAAAEACHPTDDPTGKLRLPMPPGKTSPKGATGSGTPGSARAYHDDRDVYYCRIELMTVREGKPVEPILVDLHHETGDVSLHAVPVDRPVAGTG